MWYKNNAMEKKTEQEGEGGWRIQMRRGSGENCESKQKFREKLKVKRKGWREKES